MYNLVILVVKVTSITKSDTKSSKIKSKNDTVQIVSSQSLCHRLWGSGSIPASLLPRE